jgi:uncharacterized protein (TIGR03435 family)
MIAMLGRLGSGFGWQTARPGPNPRLSVVMEEISRPFARGASLSVPAVGRITARNVSLKRLISEAYHVQTFQISGPGWLDSERFDILAKADGNRKYEEMMPMLQTLLVDRFQIKMHRETKELPLYALVIAKDGIKFRKADGDCPAVAEGKYPCGGFNINRGGLLTGYKVSIAQMTQALAFIVGRTVTDRTGLKGIYDIDVRWSADELGQEPGASAPTPDSSGPSLFSALQEQLRLKLEAQKGPVDFIVVDHAEKVPAEN